MEKYPNLTNAGKGRPKGALNRSTHERLQAWRDFIDETKISDLNMKSLLADLQDEDQRVQFKDRLALQKLLLEWACKSLDEEILEKYLPDTPEAAERDAQEVLELLAAIK